MRTLILACRVKEQSMTIYLMPTLMRWLRSGGLWLVNVLVALFGTAVIEAPFSPVFHPRTIQALLIKQYLLSALFASLLGFFVYRRWRLKTAKWVGVGGICWFLLRAPLAFSQGGLWHQMSGIGCSNGLHSIGCTNWFIFTIPAFRTVCYSAGAWICWRLNAYGSSALEDAVMVRFHGNNSDSAVRDEIAK